MWNPFDDDTKWRQNFKYHFINLLSHVKSKFPLSKDKASIRFLLNEIYF